MRIGKLVSISNMRVDILLDDCKIKPRDIVVANFEGKEYRFEVNSVQGNIAVAIPFDSVIGLKRGIDVELQQGGLSSTARAYYAYDLSFLNLQVHSFQHLKVAELLSQVLYLNHRFFITYSVM